MTLTILTSDLRFMPVDLYYPRNEEVYADLMSVVHDNHSEGVHWSNNNWNESGSGATACLVSAAARRAAGLPRVPLEVCEHIIECVPVDEDVMWLNDCERTLRACSLTCRAWRRKAQTQLFTDHIFLHRIIIQRFFRAATARPALFTMVKNVVLCGSQFEIPAVAEAFEKRAWPLDSLLTFVLMFARKLKGLERLCITRGEWKTNRPLPLGNALYQGLSTFNSLSTLVLRNLILPSAHEFKEIILAIACLTRLECQTIFWKKVGVIGPADIQARHPTLRTLHINSYAPVKLDGEGSMYAFIKDITRVLTLITPDGQITELAANLRSFREYKLHECSDPNHLNTRHTFTIHDLGGSGISQLLRHAGTALRSLRLQLTGWRYSRVEEKEMTGAVEEHLKLAYSNPNLESLEITIPYIENETSLSWLGIVLSNVNPETLRNISLDIQLISIIPTKYYRLHDSWLPLVATSRLDEILSSPRFRRLEHVTFKISANDYYFSSRDPLSRELAFLEARWRAEQVRHVFQRLKALRILTVRADVIRMRYGVQIRQDTFTGLDR